MVNVTFLKNGLKTVRTAYPCSESFCFSFSYPVNFRQPRQTDSRDAIMTLGTTLSASKQLI